MSAYSVFEDLVIVIVVGMSAWHVFRKLAPATYRSALAWVSARLRIELAPVQTAAKGCDSGCGTCATGCGSPATPRAGTRSAEQPLTFRPRKS